MSIIVDVISTKSQCFIGSEMAGASRLKKEAAAARRDCCGQNRLLMHVLPSRFVATAVPASDCRVAPVLEMHMCLGRYKHMDTWPLFLILVTHMRNKYGVSTPLLPRRSLSSRLSLSPAQNNSPTPRSLKVADTHALSNPHSLYVLTLRIQLLFLILSFPHTLSVALPCPANQSLTAVLFMPSSRSFSSS